MASLLEKAITPLPGDLLVRRAPFQVEAGEWFDLAAESTETVLEHSAFADQELDVMQAGGRPETDVSIVIKTGSRGARGRQQQRFDTTALGGFDNPVDVGPEADEDFQWQIRNDSTVDHTAGSPPRYQAFLNYVVRDLSVLEKLRRGIRLSTPEDRLQRRLGLFKRSRLNIAPQRDPVYEANLEDKNVITDGAVAETVNVNAGQSETILNRNVGGDVVVYVTGASINGQAFTAGDDVRLRFREGQGQHFYEVRTFAFPSQPYELNLHIPFLDDVVVDVSAANTVAGVDVRVEFATVQRTLLEKALYFRDHETAQVKADDDLADHRVGVFNRLRDLIDAGLPIPEEEVVRDVERDLAEAAQTAGGR